MAKILDLIYRVTDKATPGIKKIKDEQASLTSEMKKAGVAFGVVAGAAAALKGVWDQTVAPVVAYNKAMKDLSASTGVAVEDLSRLVQAGDDVGITAEAMGSAFEMATKKGFSVSVESLAALADQTNALNDPTEKAALLSGIFGKNWAALVPLLDKGGKGIRGMTAAQLAGLVVTEDEIAMTEELRLALDEISDEWTSIKNEIGLGVGGALVKGRQQADEFARGMNDALAYVQAMGLEPTRQNIDRAFKQLTSGEVSMAIFRIKDDLDALDGKSVTVYVNQVELAQSQATHPSEKRADGYYWVWNGVEMVRGARWSTNPPIERGRAAGGPVGAGGSYLIGERGPEMFTPNQSGKVSSNDDLAALTKSINRMVATLPVILRDAVQKS